MTLEPDNWRHRLRFAYGHWGEDRLRGARRTLALLPGCPSAHVLAATVHVARDALADAEREVDAGIAAMPGEASAPSRFSAVGLHWLKGLLLLARDDDRAARASFERELARATPGHLYAREISANTWYAIGASHLRRGDAAPARAAFEQVTSLVPQHLMARVGLSLLTPPPHERAMAPADAASLSDAASSAEAAGRLH